MNVTNAHLRRPLSEVAVFGRCLWCDRPMKGVLLSLVAVGLLLIGGCAGAGEPRESGEASSSGSPSAVPQESSRVSPTILPTTETPVVPPPVVDDEPALVTFECGDPSLYQSGTAIYSDGSTGYEADCDTYVPPPPDNGTGYPYDPSEDRNGDGVVNGYERCGVACGDEPTSGDIQTQHGCEQGYITGPACE